MGDERLQGERLMDKNYNPLESELWPLNRGFRRGTISLLSKLRDAQILLWDQYNSTIIFHNIESKSSEILKSNSVVSSLSTTSEAYFCHEILVTIPGGKQFRGNSEKIRNEK